MKKKKRGLMKGANMKRALAETEEAYRSALGKHGMSLAALHMPKGKQALRFEILTAPWSLAGKRVLDIGCGFADLFQFLKEKKISVDYTGIELLPEFVRAARSRYPEARIIEGEVLEALSGMEESFDVAVACGTFNFLPASAREREHREYVFECIRSMVSVSRQGVAVNFQSTYNIDFRSSIGFYLDPVEALGFCLGFGRAALRHDYMPYEYSVFIYKDSGIMRPLNVFKGWEELAAREVGTWKRGS